jgi:hypothetical protein
MIVGSCWELCCAQNYPELYPKTALLFTYLKYTSLDIYWGDVVCNASCRECAPVIPKTLFFCTFSGGGGFFRGGTAREVSAWKLTLLCVDSNKRCAGVTVHVPLGDTNLFCNAGLYACCAVDL